MTRQLIACLGIGLMIAAAPPMGAAQQADSQAGTGKAPAAAAGTSAQNRITWQNLRVAEEAPVNTVLFVRGTVLSISPPRPQSDQPWTIYLTDETGPSRAVIFQDTYNAIADKSFLKPGMRLDLYVITNDYRGVRQLLVREANHVRQTPGSAPSAFAFGRVGQDGAPIYFPMTIGAINIPTIGQPVRIRGTVQKIEESDRERVPWRLLVKDPSGEIEVIYWKATHDSIPADERPVMGQAIEVSGVVNEFRGKIQLRVDDGAMVRRNFTETARRSQPGGQSNSAAALNAGSTTGPQ